MRHTIYIGSSLHNHQQVIKLRDILATHGIHLSYDWTAHGQVFDQEHLTKICINEVDGVKKCDMFLLIQPGRNGSHCELGLAIAFDKPIIILNDGMAIENKPFYYHQNITHAKTEAEAINLILTFFRNHQ